MNEQATKSIILVVLLSAAFAVGRYSVQKPEIKQTTVTSDKTKTDEKKDVRTVTVSKTVYKCGPDNKPGGTIETDTTTTTAAVTKIDETQTDSTKSITDIIPPKTGKLNISALSGTGSNLIPLYGISLQKEVLGPLTIGGFGLFGTNNIIGVSAGMNF